MKSIRWMFAATVVLAATVGVAQTSGQKSFDAVKLLAGSWQGTASDGQPVQVSYRSTASGSALLSEIVGHHGDMITMFHMDGDRFLMTHYCDAGNQPRMVGTASPDGKSVSFEFLDATNLAGPKAGHMQHVVFTIVDANHHTEEWTFLKDGKEMRERFDLQRAPAAQAKL